MKYTIGDAWAILKDRKSGNKEDAYSMLDNMKPGDYKETNRQEGRVRARINKKAYRVGDRPNKRWTT
jgi:hypothetical protein